jgi:hypothetical protein
MRRALWARAIVLLSGLAGAAFGILVHASRTPAQGSPTDAPSGTVIYTTASACPAGWNDATFVQGRLIVGTSTPGNVGSPAGNVMPADGPPTHVHDVSVPITLANKRLSQGALSGRPKAGRSGDYTVVGTTTVDASGAPLLQLRACRKP